MEQKPPPDCFIGRVYRPDNDDPLPYVPSGQGLLVGLV